MEFCVAPTVCAASLASLRAWLLLVIVMLGEIDWLTARRGSMPAAMAAVTSFVVTRGAMQVMPELADCAGGEVGLAAYESAGEPLGVPVVRVLVQTQDGRFALRAARAHRLAKAAAASAADVDEVGAQAARQQAADVARGVRPTSPAGRRKSAQSTEASALEDWVAPARPRAVLEAALGAAAQSLDWSVYEPSGLFGTAADATPARMAHAVARAEAALLQSEIEELARRATPPASPRAGGTPPPSRLGGASPAYEPFEGEVRPLSEVPGVVAPRSRDSSRSRGSSRRSSRRSRRSSAGSETSAARSTAEAGAIAAAARRRVELVDAGAPTSVVETMVDSNVPVAVLRGLPIEAIAKAVKEYLGKAMPSLERVALKAWLEMPAPARLPASLAEARQPAAAPAVPTAPAAPPAVVSQPIAPLARPASTQQLVSPPPPPLSTPPPSEPSAPRSEPQPAGVAAEAFGAQLRASMREVGGQLTGLVASVPDAELPDLVQTLVRTFTPSREALAPGGLEMALPSAMASVDEALVEAGLTAAEALGAVPHMTREGVRVMHAVTRARSGTTGTSTSAMRTAEGGEVFDATRRSIEAIAAVPRALEALDAARGTAGSQLLSTVATLQVSSEYGADVARILALEKLDKVPSGAKNAPSPRAQRAWALLIELRTRTRAARGETWRRLAPGGIAVDEVIDAAAAGKLSVEVLVGKASAGKPAGEQAAQLLRAWPLLSTIAATATPRDATLATAFLEMARDFFDKLGAQPELALARMREAFDEYARLFAEFVRGVVTEAPTWRAALVAARDEAQTFAYLSSPVKGKASAKAAGK